ADAHSRIGEETDLDIVAHVRMPALIRTVCAFADHLSKTEWRARRSRPAIFVELILCLPSHGLRHLCPHQLPVFPAVYGLSHHPAHICARPRRTRDRVAICPARCCTCRLWLP